MAIVSATVRATQMATDADGAVWCTSCGNLDAAATDRYCSRCGAMVPQIPRKVPRPQHRADPDPRLQHQDDPRQQQPQ